MIDPRTPIEKIAEMCNSMEDLGNLFKQCNFKKNKDDGIPISPELLQEAISKTNHLKTITRSDIQRLLGIGYPKAAKICGMLANPENGAQRDLYEYIRTHLLAAVYGNIPDTEKASSGNPAITAVKTINGNITDTVTVSLDENGKKELNDFLSGCTLIGYGAQLNYFRKIRMQYGLNLSRPAVDIAAFAQDPTPAIGNSEKDFFGQLEKYGLPKPNTPIEFCRAVIHLLFSYAKTQAFYQYLHCIYALRIETQPD